MDKVWPVSIQICTFNEEKVIERCLRSCIANKVAEIFVIDGNSSDLTVTKSLQMGVKVLQASGPSLSKQRVLGITSTTQPYIAFVDADDELDCDWIEKLLIELNKSEVSGIQSQIKACGESSDNWLSRCWDRYFFISNTPTLKAKMIGRPVLYKSEIFSDLIRYRESDLYAAEDEFMHRELTSRGHFFAISSSNVKSTRIVQTYFWDNFTKFVRYGFGYAQSMRARPQSIPSHLLHIYIRIPILRVTPFLIKGHVSQALFGLTQLVGIQLGIAKYIFNRLGRFSRT